MQSLLMQWRLRDGLVAVLGGQDLALARARLAQDGGARCWVFSDAPCPAVREAAGAGRIRLLPLDAAGGGPRLVGPGAQAANDAPPDAEPPPTEGAEPRPDLAFCVPDAQASLEELARLARAAWGCPVNVADQPQQSDFLMPALLRRPPLQIGVASGGASPTAVKLARERLEAALPAGLGELALALGRWRQLLPQGTATGEAGRILRGLAQGAAGREALHGDGARADRLASAELGEQAAAGTGPERSASADTGPARQAPAGAGLVQIVGAGPGGTDALTLGAMRAMASCDVLVHDRLVADDILELARAEARLVAVGKASGGKGWKQRDINALLVRLAGEGAQVCRLKGGDPGVFGRLDEEIGALAEAGVAFEVIPGVSAAMGCAAWAGIPLTHRGHSHLCVLVTGHTGKDADDPPWEALARLPGTLAIYMGLYRLPEVARRLQEGGKDARTPALAVSRGGTPRQRILAAPLGRLAERVAAQEMASPMLVLIGPVAGMYRGEAG